MWLGGEELYTELSLDIHLVVIAMYQVAQCRWLSHRLGQSCCKIMNTIATVLPGAYEPPEGWLMGAALRHS